MKSISQHFSTDVLHKIKSPIKYDIVERIRDLNAIICTNRCSVFFWRFYKTRKPLKKIKKIKKDN